MRYHSSFNPDTAVFLYLYLDKYLQKMLSANIWRLQITGVYSPYARSTNKNQPYLRPD